jgi:outer membrane protein assembly factor BamB
MQGLAIGGNAHNVVFVATEHNSVYAFDADNPQAAAPLWKVSLGTPAPLVPKKNIRCADMFPEQGITSTPVIDPATGTMYVTGVTFNNGVYSQKLHALDIHTGAERAASPVEITSAGFDPHWQLSRAGLLLDNGTIYIAYASNCDQGPYHGWIFAYDAATFTQKGAYNNTVGGKEGGIWMSGVGLPSDGTSIYFAGGNGSFDASNHGAQLGISFGRMQLTGGGLSVADYYTPDNAQQLNNADSDLTTVIALPNSNLLVGGSKAGQLYVMDRTNMGRYNPGSDTHQRIPVGGHVHGGPVYWLGPSGPRVYVWSEQSPLQAFAVGSNALGATPVAKSTVVAGGHPGGIVTLSANGTANGIVWGSFAPVGDGFHTLVKGILVAFDANDLHVLWRSDANARDTVGNFAKFNPPVVANGRVYLGSQSNALRVYGPL